MPALPERLDWFSSVTTPPLVELVLKLAVALALLVPAGIVQLLLLPEQAPLQPANVLPLAAWAVRVTALVLAKLAVAPLQSVAQLKPLGLLLTLPVPVPILLRVTMRFVAATLKLAVTLRAALIVTEQLLLVPVQAPLQPAKLLPDAACAVNVTCVPAA